MVAAGRNWPVQVAIVGADTALGRSLARTLAGQGCQVVGLGEMSLVPDCEMAYRQTDYASFDLPVDCGIVLYCHDAAQSPARHAVLLDNLCRELSASRTPANQVRLGCFTPANACESKARSITESAHLHPHGLRELSYAQVELLLHAWCNLSRTAILPMIFRHGELYGTPSGLQLPGHVAQCLRIAQARQTLRLPGLGIQKRSLTHLDDLAAAVGAFLSSDCPQNIINLPGERQSIIDYMGPIADHYQTDLVMSSDCYDDDLPWGLGDRVLSTAQFRTVLPDFRLEHRFRPWLLAGTESTIPFHD